MIKYYITLYSTLDLKYYITKVGYLYRDHATSEFETK